MQQLGIWILRRDSTRVKWDRATLSPERSPFHPLIDSCCRPQPHKSWTMN